MEKEFECLTDMIEGVYEVKIFLNIFILSPSNRIFHFVNLINLQNMSIIYPRGWAIPKLYIE